MSVSQSGGWVGKCQLLVGRKKKQLFLHNLQNHDSIAWNGAERQNLMLLCMVGATSWKQLTCVHRAAGIII